MRGNKSYSLGAIIFTNKIAFEIFFWVNITYKCKVGGFPKVFPNEGA
jgi:hypothetical protein